MLNVLHGGGEHQRDDAGYPQDDEGVPEGLKELRDQEAHHKRQIEVIFLMLAEIERLYGVDPAASEINPHYRN